MAATMVEFGITYISRSVSESTKRAQLNAMSSTVVSVSPYLRKSDTNTHAQSASTSG